jgi:hypothetical protein
MPLDIRLYPGFAGQAGRLSAVRHELEALLRPVKGLRRFILLETTEGLATVTEGEDRAACQECGRRAEVWMRERMPGLEGYRPLTAVGEIIAEANAGTASNLR